MKKHSFTILNLEYDNESPMIGTIADIENTRMGCELFKKKLEKAVNSHFDPVTPFVFSETVEELICCGSAYEDVEITVDGEEQNIRIIETWNY